MLNSQVRMLHTAENGAHVEWAGLNIHFDFATITCYLLHFNEVEKFRKMSAEIKRLYFCGVLINVHQTNSNASQPNKVSLNHFILEKTKKMTTFEFLLEWHFF
jgi:hypothetical protein